MDSLADRRVLVVGSSSGIGRALAGVLVEAGARVAISARRADRLEALAKDLGGGVVVVPGDVRNPEDCQSVVARAVDALGGLDGFVFAAGVAVLELVSDADAASWRRVLEINLVGPSLLTSAALGPLRESRGHAIYLSSISSNEIPPRRGLGLYATSKAGLDKLIEVWQNEHPAVSFTRVNVGDTTPTEMAVGWDAAKLPEFVQEWTDRGFLFGRMMEADTVARHVASLLACPETIGITRITPRPALD